MFSLILMGCSHNNITNNKSFADTCNTDAAICKRNYGVLAEEIEKFNAAGGAFILVNLKNNEVLNSASISILESFDYNKDFSYTPNNVMKQLKKKNWQPHHNLSKIIPLSSNQQEKRTGRVKR